MVAMKLALKAVLLTLSLGASAAPKYSATVFQRPFTMPQNSFESRLSFSNKNVAELGFDYGITNDIQMGVSWDGFDKSNMPEQALSINAAAYLFSTRYVSSFAKLSMPIYFENQAIKEISAGMPTYIPLIRGKLNLLLLERLATVQWANETSADFAFNTKLSWQATHSLC